MKTTDTAYFADIADKTAYTKGWESQAKTPDAAADKFAEKYGPEARECWIVGYRDKENGLAKWTNFDVDGSVPDDVSSITESFDIEIDLPEDEEQVDIGETMSESFLKTMRESSRHFIGPKEEIAGDGQGLVDESAVAEALQDKYMPADEVLEAVTAFEGDYVSIAAQRDLIDPKTWSKAEVAAARAAVVKRKTHHRAGYAAAKRGEKPMETVAAKYAEKFGETAAQDYRNGYLEQESGEACGTVWAKQK